MLANEAHLGVYRIDGQQLSNVGEYHTVELSDNNAMQLMRNIQDEPCFANFSDIIRSDKYIICRVARDWTPDEKDGSHRRIFGPHNSETFTQRLFHRNQYCEGDVRVHFEYVEKLEVSVLAQQIQDENDIY